MVRNLIRNQAPGNRLRVRIPCPPLDLFTLLTCLLAWLANPCNACSCSTHFEYLTEVEVVLRIRWLPFQSPF